MGFLVRRCKACSNNASLYLVRSSPLSYRHIHWKQTEYFQVEQGVIGIHKNGKEIRATKDDGIIEVPAGTR